MTSPGAGPEGKSPRKATGRNPASRIGVGLVAAALFIAPLLGQATEEESRFEYEVKAVFLYNFTRYLQWPEEPEGEAFAIAVLGESGIVEPLRAIAGQKTVGSLPIVVRQCAAVEEIGRPRILFVARSAVLQLPRVLEKTRGTSILIVGEAEGLGSRGVAVNFVLRDGAVKFEMNERALDDARIQVGSQLLKLAILVDAEKGSGAR